MTLHFAQTVFCEENRISHIAHLERDPDPWWVSDVGFWYHGAPGMARTTLDPMSSMATWWRNSWRG